MYVKKIKMSNADIIDRVHRFMTKELSLDISRPVLVGLSGGADSVALLSILKELGYICIACHCNFQLRGEESERDRDFASYISKEMDVPFQEIRFDTVAYTRENKLSIEMACRELRYRWFEELRIHSKAQAIAIAHHRDDSVETVLLNLIRGTGISGLTGISPTNGFVVRPLLCITRRDIETYLAEKSLSFVTDSTNRENIYIRNKIRLEVLPLLETINPSVYDALERTAKNLSGVEKIYNEAIAAQIEKVCCSRDGKIYIGIESLLRQPSPETLLFELIRKQGFISAQLKDILFSLQRDSGKVFESSTHYIIKDRTSLIIVEKEDMISEFTPLSVTKDDRLITDPITLTFTYIVHDDQYNIPKEKKIACFDADKLPFPLTLRHWQEGDRFVPFGMRGSQKLSDYFNNHKFSLDEKNQAFVLCAGGEIIWLVGERSSDKYRINPETGHVLQIEYKK